jgi:hypothetical protein
MEGCAVSGPFRTTYRELSPYEKQLVEDIKQKAELLYGLFNAAPFTREIGIAKTKLEEAVMWAVKGITG